MRKISGRLVHREQIRVRFTDADAQGASHHSSYVKWLEEARLGWLRSIGSPYRETVHDDGLALVVTKLEIEYLRPTTYEQQVLVEVFLRRLNRVRLGVDYQVLFPGDPAPAAQARTELAFTDLAGQPTRLPRDHRLWLALKPLVSELDRP